MEREQAYVDLLYAQVEAQRESAARELAEVLRAEPGGTRQARVERGADVGRLGRRIAALDAAENGLCFGRLDGTDGSRRYLGRIGLRGDDADEEPLLIDWRAPAARPFYTATAAAPQGVRLRRHLHTRGRRVTRVDDELLDGSEPVSGDVRLSGEAALLATLQAERTGRMKDAVATLQGEQDRIIRGSHEGVLVVQGGPGTGKTVVALHRAAYLLYSRPRLDERGVLVVGPNPVFLGYVSQVLPGLGETSVLLSSLGELYPGVTALREEPGAVAEIKGRPVMAEVLATAVRNRQAAVGGPVTVEVGNEQLRLEPEVLADLAERARSTGQPHNPARRVFAQYVVEELARRLARMVADIEDRFEEDLAGLVDSAALDRAAQRDLAGVFGDEVPEVDLEAQADAEFADAEQHWLHALPGEPVVHRLVQRLWPVLTPGRLLEELYADPSTLAEAAPQLTGDERELLRRDRGGDWSPADVPLLDEAAELLGVDDSAERALRVQERREHAEYAKGVMEILHGSRAAEDDDAADVEHLVVDDVLDADELAQGHAESDLRTVAERAAADRTWVFGHVIVDEAQELSPMAWRLLVRRCPTRSFTIVGDVAQTGEAAGSASWAAALEPHFGDRWRLEQLTINYRTPHEIMSASDRVLDALDAEASRPHAVRGGGVPPRRERVEAAELPVLLPASAAEEAKAVGTGRVAVIAPQEDVERLAEAVRDLLPEVSWGAEPDLERRVVVLSPRQSKGLEFDSVLVVDPQSVLDGSPRGLNDLYVALTRASRRLVIVHPGPVPEVLAHVEERAAS